MFGTRSAGVALCRFLVSNPRFIGVLPELPPGPPLTEQIPALIQHDLQVPKSLTIGVACGAVRLPLEELVLLARKLVDFMVDRCVVHRALPVRARDVGCFNERQVRGPT